MFGLVGLAVGVVACAGGGRLIHTGDLVLGIAVVVVGLIIMFFGALPWFMLSWHGRRRALHIVLEPVAAGRFRAAVKAERESLGPTPMPVKAKTAADKLWFLAAELSQASRHDEPPTGHQGA
ncbi:hypothetical protein AB0B31_15070 [Catellatospora citrea]|uniref:hypothetical protein n=1 Tax=Catellatospora citrea TaxID=53366 RepID=UPI00340DE0A0